MLRAAVSATHSTRTSVSFFVTTPPPPRSRLFPYTTLFRSPRLTMRKTPIMHKISRDSLMSLEAYARARKDFRAKVLAHKKQDRKSTRLNSSHMSISYAVFCLTKKIRTENRHYNPEANTRPT